MITTIVVTALLSTPPSARVRCTVPHGGQRRRLERLGVVDALLLLDADGRPG